MKHTKKTISLALVLLLTLTFLPQVPAFAASPNTTAATAIDIPLGTTMNGEGQYNLNNSHVGNDREQWYKVTTNEKGSLQVNVSYAWECGNSYGTPYISIYFYDTSGKQIEIKKQTLVDVSKEGTTGNKTMSTEKLRMPPGTYYVRMYAEATNFYHKYGLTPVLTAEGDGYETEWNDTRETATPIALNTPVIGNLNYRDDVDFFKVNILRDGKLHVRADHIGGADKYSHTVELQSSAGIAQKSMRLDDSFANFRTTDDINVKAGETYYIRMLRYSTYYHTEYKLTAVFTDASSIYYELSVTNGTGSGSYNAGVSVPISAGAPAAGKVFDKWTGGNGGTFADANSASTTFTMPGNAATVTATYKNATTYTLTVSGGTGSGSYASGTQVAISANAPASGKMFDKWTGGNGGTFLDANSATTVFTMPGNAATVTATYKDDTETHEPEDPDEDEELEHAPFFDYTGWVYIEEVPEKKWTNTNLNHKSDLVEKELHAGGYYFDRGFVVGVYGVNGDNWTGNRPGKMNYTLDVEGKYDYFRMTVGVKRSLPAEYDTRAIPRKGTLTIKVDGVTVYNKTLVAGDPNDLIYLDLSKAKTIEINVPDGSCGLLFGDPYFRKTSAEPKPDPINNFNVEQVNLIGVKLQWNAIQGSVGYRVFRSETQGELGIPATDFYCQFHEYIDVNVKPNTTYYYTIKQILKEATTQGDPEVYGAVSEQIRVTSPGKILGDDLNRPDTSAQKKVIIMQIDDPMMTLPNGKLQEIDPGRGTMPIIRNDRTLSPIRAIVEDGMGGTVDWDGDAREVSLTFKQNNVRMWIDNDTIRVNGSPLQIDVAPTIINDRTMLPARAVIESLGGAIEFINSTRQIVIVYY